MMPKKNKEISFFTTIIHEAAIMRRIQRNLTIDNEIILHKLTKADSIKWWKYM